MNAIFSDDNLVGGLKGDKTSAMFDNVTGKANVYHHKKGAQNLQQLLEMNNEQLGALFKSALKDIESQIIPSFTQEAMCSVCINNKDDEIVMVKWAKLSHYLAQE